MFRSHQSGQRKCNIQLLCLFLVLSILYGCGAGIKDRFIEMKDVTLERVKVFLVDLPLVGRWVKLHPKPSSLYQRVAESIQTLKSKGAEKYLPDEFAKLEKEWNIAKKIYSEKLYLRAEKKLKALDKKAKELNERLEKTLSALRYSAIQKYKEREAELHARLKSLSEDDALKVKVYLFYLNTLIEQGRFEEFEKELAKAPF